MSQVEQSIQLQIQDIAAVKQAFAEALTTETPPRSPDTLWWLVDNSGDITYENRVKGSNILAVDQNVDNVNIASMFSDWFNLQNAYFSQDQPFGANSGVSTLQDAITKMYRFRVPQYFNDIATGAGSAGIPAQYVFPYPDFNLGDFPTSGTFAKGTGPVTASGPGILGVIPVGGPTTSAGSLSITAVYPTLTPPASSPPPPVPPPITFSSVVVPSGSPAGVPVNIGGGQTLTAAYTPDTVGSVSVPAGPTTGFAVGYPVVIAENTLGSPTALPIWISEVAEVVSIGSGNTSMVLRQPTPPGGTAFTPGLRNAYTTAAKVYPLFADVTAVTGTGGGVDLHIGFFPDWGRGFVDITSIQVSQVEGQSMAFAEASSAQSDTESESPPHPKSPIYPPSSKPQSSSPSHKPPPSSR